MRDDSVVVSRYRIGWSPMIFRQLLNEPIAAASYLIGCAATGEAAVVDPSLPADQYALLAADKGLRITWVLETHLHADYFSTGRALAGITGASLGLPCRAEARFAHHALRDDEILHVGNLLLHVLHTPGHTPEHICYLVADTPRAEQPWFVLTGDCLFVGDVGRADLVDLPLTGPEPLYESIVNRLLTLPDGVEIFPAHYGGSACGGKAMSGKASSTIGFERRFNWALQAPDRATFAEWVSGTPRAAVEAVLLHRHTNQGLLPLPAAIGTAWEPVARVDVAVLSASDVVAAVQNEATLLDVRPREAFAHSHIPGALCAPFNRDGLAGRVALLCAPGEPLVVLAEQELIAAEAASLLAGLGRNPLWGRFAGALDELNALGAPQLLEQLDVDELHRRVMAKSTSVLDVREPFEWARGIVAGARTIAHGQLRERIHELPSGPVSVICESGTRATIAASLLQHHGRALVSVVAPQGMSDYAARYPTTQPS